MFGRFFRKKSVVADSPEAGAASLGIDLEMSYCPSCGDEYRAGIAQCVSCNVALISAEEKLAEVQRKVGSRAGRSMDISSDDTLVTIRNGKLKDLKELKRVLAAERIPALLSSESGGCRQG